MGKATAEGKGSRKKREKGTFFALFLLCLILGLSAPKAGLTAYASGAFTEGGSQVTVEADYGFGGEAREGRYLPIEVSYSNEKGSAFTGTLRILTLESNMEVYQYEYPVELKPGEKKTEEYYVPLGVENDQIFLSLLDWEENEVVRKRLKLDISSESAVMFVGALSDDPDSLDYLDDAGFNYGTLRTRLVPLTAEKIPENELGLDQFDLVVVDDFDWNTLTQEQEEAVFSWVEEGGTLLFGTGAQLEKNLGRLGSRFLEADAGNISSREIELSGPEEDSRAVMVSADCVDFGVKEGRVVLSSGSTSVVTKKNQGNGQIVFTAFGLADIAEVCAQNPVVLEGLFQQIMGKETIQYLAQDQYYSLSNLYYSIQSLINTGNVARLPKVGLYTAVILVYIVLIGPVLYLYLKRKSCQNYYMVSVAVLAVIFTGVIYAMGAKTRFTAPFFTYATVESYGDDEVERETYINVRSPYNTPYTVELNPEYTVRPVTKNYFYESNKSAVFTGRERYQTAVSLDEAKTEIRVRDSVAFEPGLFVLKKKEGLENRAPSSSVTFYDGKISGTIVNHSDMRIENAMLLLYGKAVFLGDMEPGEKKELDGLEVLTFPVSYKYALAEMVTGADQYSRADISDEKYLESQDKSKLLTFYLDSDMNEYFSDARLIAFHSEEEKPDFLASDTFETEGLTLTTARIPVNQKADGRTYRCALEQYPKIRSGSYDQRGNTVYVGEPSEPLVLEYFLGSNLEIDSLTMDWISPEFVDNPRYQYLEKFDGSMYFYNYETGRNDRMDLTKTVYTKEELRPYLSPSNSITVRYSGEAKSDTAWNMILPILYVTGRES